ncbi:MAG TPA: phosphatase PAP2 family protein [Dehalococcoidia bacterium]
MQPEVRRRWGRRLPRRSLAEFGLVTVAFLLYFLVRGAVVDRADEALSNARDLVALEQQLGFYWEPAWQAPVLRHELLIRLANLVYFWFHFPLICVVGLWLYHQQRIHYTLTRNALLISGAVGLVIYNLYPVAPPRYLPELGLVDTMAVYSRVNYEMQETRWFVNPYAAVPSLHFGWNLLLGIGVFLATRNLWWRIFAVIMPAGMFWAIVVTGNHFIIDAVIGGAVCLAGLAAAAALHRWSPPALRFAGGVLVAEAEAPPSR